MLSPAMAATSSRRYKRVQWREWRGKKRPGVLSAIRDELVRALETKAGSVWLRVKDSAVVAGYSKMKRLDGRTRALRSDAAASLLAFAASVLGSADIRSGFVGTPRPGGGAWKRHALDDLCQLAFGAQTDADLRRGQRAWDVMLSLGWAWPAEQVRQQIGPDRPRPDWRLEFRSEAAVRKINLDRLAEMTGLTWMLQRDRAAIDGAKGERITRLRKAVEGPRRCRSGDASREALRLQEALRAVPPKAPDPPHPPRPPRPSDPAVARAALAEMKLIFD
jgi:hypothetical protein